MRVAWLVGLCVLSACDEGRVVGTTPTSHADAAVTPGEDGAAPGEDAQPTADAEPVQADAGATSPDATAAADATATTDAGSPADARFARGITLEHVSLFQAVKVMLVSAGVEPRPRNSPVIAERDAMVRLYVRPGAGWTRQAVTGVLEIDGARRTQVLSIGGPSIEDDAATVFSFEVPGAELREGGVWSAWLESATGAPLAMGTDAARWPRGGGTSALRAQQDGGGLKLMLVPMSYATDGSNRLPDTSPQQLAIYHDLLAALYPVAHVDLQVHAPVRWDRSLTFRGNVNFDALNDMMVDLRAAESPASDVYYYALINAAADFGDYCGGGCVTGQSYVPEDPTDPDLRVGAGMGFTGTDSAWTMVHEVGHLHGRYHAPCGVDSWDSDYPYLDGDIGVWGYDPTDGSILEPQAGWSDFMGYCDDQWVSDYTFAAIFERVIEQRGGRVIQRRIPWLGLTLTVDREVGSAELGDLRSWGQRPNGPRARVQFTDLFGRVVGWGEATRLVRSHELTERYVIEAPPAGALRARIAGVGTFDL